MTPAERLSSAVSSCQLLLESGAPIAVVLSNILRALADFAHESKKAKVCICPDS